MFQKREQRGRKKIIDFQADNRIRDISEAKRECQLKVKKDEVLTVLNSVRRQEDTRYTGHTIAPYIHDLSIRWE
jgi:hypothetical protein